MGDLGSMAPDFSRREFACRHCGVYAMQGPFVFAVQALRNAMAEPLVINSGYRCPEHNAAVGGVRNSQHVAGRAVDILVRDSAHRMKLVSAAIRCGFHGIGIAEDFVHVDDRPDGSRLMWIYPATVTAAKKR